MISSLPILSGLLALTVLSCSSPSTGVSSEPPPENPVAARQPAGARPSLSLERVWPDLKLDRPLYLLPIPGQSRGVVVEQPGRIQVFSAAGSGGDAKVFLDLRPKVFPGHNEEGLLGMAFHPKFADNRTFYVYYSANGPRRSVISRFTMRADDPTQVDPASEKVLLEVPQPYGNHNGGHIVFGPDGFFYIGLGDGGSGGDPHGHGQNPRTLLGSILRIDVDRPSDGRPYGIPADNPFADGRNGAPEVFAYGLRNPWRFSFDRRTGRIWAGDVGQNRQEEIDIIEKGKNYGWNRMEGTLCFEPGENCRREGLVMPVTVYGRQEGISVTGGYVYRALRYPALQGWYLFGDYGSGQIWGIPAEGEKPGDRVLLLESGRNISSFAEDAAGELFLVDHNGRLYRLATR